MAEIAELIEANTAVVVQISDLVGRATETVAELDSGLQELIGRIDTEAEAAHTAAVALTGRLDALSTHLVEHQQTITSLFEEWQGALTGLGTRLQQEVESFDSQLDALDQQVDAVDDLLEQQTERLREALDSHDSAAAEIEGAFVARLGDVEQQVQTMTATVDERTATATEAYGETGEQLEAFGAMAEAQLQETADLFGALIERADAEFGEFEQHTTSGVDQIVTLAGDLLKETPDEFFGDQSDSVVAAIDSLSEVAEAARTVFDGDVGRVMQQVDGVLEVIEQIKPVLDAAAEI